MNQPEASAGQGATARIFIAQVVNGYDHDAERDQALGERGRQRDEAQRGHNQRERVANGEAGHDADHAA